MVLKSDHVAHALSKYVDLNKCLKQIELPILLHVHTISELPFNINYFHITNELER